MSVRRRRFLGFTIGAAAGTMAGGAVGRAFIGLLSSADSPLYPPRGTESFVLSVCNMCPGGCGLRVRRIGERVVKVEGNPLHPVNGGRLCPKGQAALQDLYHPDRLRGPMHRVGPRGSIRSFESVSWDQALDAIAGRLRMLRERGHPEALVMVRGGSRGIGPRLARRFLEAFGSPNDVVLDRGEEAAALALELGQGVRASPAYDVQAADYVLSLGGALLEASSSPVYMMRAYGEFRQGRTGRRGKLVQVEPRLSPTAASADEWIAVRPGTEGTFALGVAAVLVSEGLYDRDFVAERTVGFEDGEEGRGRSRGLRNYLAQGYRLERVSTETGVPVNTILRISREFAAARSSLAIGPRKGPLLPGPLEAHVAAHVLNALAGNLDGPGGLLVPEEPPLAPWTEPPRDALAGLGRRRPRLDGVGNSGPRARSDPERLAEAILAGSPYEADVVMLLGADPVLTSASPERFARALERVPLTVSFATKPDDTALYADWILPEAHFLEAWDLFTTPPGVPVPVVSLAQPALAKPLRDVRPAADVFTDLARRLGGQVASALPWKDLPSLLRAELDGLYQARRGTVMGTAFDEAWVRMMEGAGWWAPGYRSADQLWEKARESGGWWDPFYDHGDWRRVLRTATGRCEFRTDVLERLSPWAGRENGEAPPAESGATLALLLFEPLPIAGGVGAELPFLQGIVDAGHPARWETWAEIHPETASRLGVGDGDWVRVTSSQGACVARARVGPRVVPGVLAMPVGLGKRGGGRWSRDVGANPLRLLAPGREAVSGLPDLGSTRVQVSRAAGPVARTGA